MVGPQTDDPQISTMTADRIATIDVVRGVAVMGILLMNIVAFGLPMDAYLNPTTFGNEGPADLIAWAVNYVLADGKFRALFTMLFGASTVLIADRADASEHGPGAVATHYRRMGWLFVIGMAHAWGIWFGDILVQYSIAGMLGFLLWRAPRRALWTTVVAMLALQSAANIGRYADLAILQSAANAPNASADAIAKWQGRVAEERGDPAATKREIAGYRGNVASIFETRARATTFFQTVVVPLSMPEVLGFLALGILFFRNGFLTGAWRTRGYAMTIALGYGIGIPVMAMLASHISANAFDPAAMAFGDAIGLLPRPFVALAHAAGIILLVKSGPSGALLARIEAAGRMALSNYLGTSIIATTLFYGYGFSLFATFSRAELYGIVLAIWLLILLWSKPWLARFHYGPAEWLWRSLAKWEWQAFRKR
jgi:uncharacterized protein